MKKTFRIGGGIVICLTLLLVTLRATGFEPKACASGRLSWTCRVPGLWLRGDVVTAPVTDWSFTDHYPAAKVETRDWSGLPHSVTTWCVTTGGELYLMSAYHGGEDYPHGRHWNENVARDPRVRLKVGDQLFERTLVHVTDPGIRAAVIHAQVKKYPMYPLALDPSIHVFQVVDPRAAR